MKRYQWEWCTGRRLSWLRGGGTRWLWATWGEWLGGERMLFPVLPAPLAARLLRRAGRLVRRLQVADLAAGREPVESRVAREVEAVGEKRRDAP